MPTNSDPTTDTIIKTTRSGRGRYTDEFKREVLAAYESSNLNGSDFARQCGVKYPTLATWISDRQRSGQSSAKRNAPAFLIAEVASSPHPSALEVRLPGGALARVSDAAQARLLAALLQQLS